MKKSELKNIIKECVKEVIFEEGVLSGIIMEVSRGMSSVQQLGSAPPQPAKLQAPSAHARQIQEAKQEVLSAIAGDAYKDLKNRFPDPSLFEGTVPLPSSGGKASALNGVNPTDAGVDLSSIPGMGKWGAIAANSERKG